MWEAEIWWELEVEWDALEIDTGDGNLRRTSSEWVGWLVLEFHCEGGAGGYGMLPLATMYCFAVMGARAVYILLSAKPT